MAGVPKVTEIDPLGDLLAATAGGDRRAFARVYQLAGSRLFAVALRIVGRRDAAEEVLQEAFLTIWQKAGQYRSDRGSPIPWMATIVRHRAIDRLRAENRAPRDLAEWNEQTEAKAAPNLRQPIFPGDLTETVRGCLERLKNNQREAIVLAYYYGLTHEELAAQLDSPMGTVKSWVRRGLLQLKDCLDQ